MYRELINLIKIQGNSVDKTIGTHNFTDKTIKALDKPMFTKIVRKYIKYRKDERTLEYTLEVSLRAIWLIWLRIGITRGVPRNSAMNLRVPQAIWIFGKLQNYLKCPKRLETWKGIFISNLWLLKACSYAKCIDIIFSKQPDVSDSSFRTKFLIVGMFLPNVSHLGWNHLSTNNQNKM